MSISKTNMTEENLSVEFRLKKYMKQETIS